MLDIIRLINLTKNLNLNRYFKQWWQPEEGIKSLITRHVTQGYGAICHFPPLLKLITEEAQLESAWIGKMPETTDTQVTSNINFPGLATMINQYCSPKPFPPQIINQYSTNSVSNQSVPTTY